MQGVFARPPLRPQGNNDARAQHQSEQQHARQGPTAAEVKLCLEVVEICRRFSTLFRCRATSVQLRIRI